MLFLLTLNFPAFAVDRKAHFFLYPVFIFDQSKITAKENLPPRFRLMPFHAAGSGEFNKLQLLNAIKKMHEPIYIVDLRQESHGFINGDLPISLYGNHNAINQNLTAEQLHTIENKVLKEISSQPNLIFVQRDKTAKYNFYGDAEKGIWGSSITIPIHEVASEKMFVKSLGLFYQRFPVTDHMPPDNYTVIQFLNFYQTLPENSWLYFHCHGGAGRTTTFLAMVAILKNGETTTLNAILARQHVLGGSNLRDIKITRPLWFTQAARQRLEFIQQFYNYVHFGSYKKGISWEDFQTMNTIT